MTSWDGEQKWDHLRRLPFLQFGRPVDVFRNQEEVKERTEGGKDGDKCGAWGRSEVRRGHLVLRSGG